VAHSCVYDSLIPDEERHFSTIAASGLGIPIHHYPGDQFGFDNSQGARSYPEPLDDHGRTTYADYCNRQFGSSGRVALTGVDGDGPLRASWTGHFRRLLGAGKPVQAAADAIRLTRAKQRLGGAIWRRMPWGRGKGEPASPPLYPQWLNPEFEKRNGLRQRWEEQAWESSWPGGGTRAAAYRNMTLPRWARLFEIYDAGVTGVAVDSRHPLLDLRLLRFLLSLPAVPWCIDKHVMRKAAAGALPRTIINRPKTGLKGDPNRILAKPFLSGLPARMHFDYTLQKFVDPRRFKNVLERSDHEPYWVNLRPAILDRWLSGCTKGKQ
jgi:asparagine synthase (glutamine-hydrolysing)